ncbi:MAG: D-alanyl-D-alanine carboxypeptidase [Bacteroidota bacterium]
MRKIHIRFFLLPGVLYLLQACSSTRVIVQNEQKQFLTQPELRSAHVGICVYDETAATFLYKYQSDKYFTPASNTKLFSLYAGLKYLGDSLPGIRYVERDTDILILPTGDPTLLHPDYLSQPVIDFLKQKKRNIYIDDACWQDKALGAGWSWDDYNDDYSQERNALPVYGNIIKWAQTQQDDGSFISFSIPEINWKVNFNTDTGTKKFVVRRSLGENIFEITQGTEKYKGQYVPFVTHGIGSAVEL